MKKFGAAIIGCGNISVMHEKGIGATELAELKAVVDIRRERAKILAARNNCSYYTDYRDILTRDDIDVVHICTPHYLHAPIAIECMKAGKHILTEKPISDMTDSAREMGKTAREQNVVLGVTFQNRYNKTSQIMRKIIDSGELGKLIGLRGIVTWMRKPEYYLSSDWRGKWETEGGGVLINQAIHTLDLLQWFGGSVASVKGSVSTDYLDGIIEVEDTAHALIEFRSGARGVFYATNGYVYNAPVEIELVFEKGRLNMRGIVLTLTQNKKETVLCQAHTENGEKSYWGTSHKLLIDDFYRCLSEGRHFWIDAEEGSRALVLLKDIYRSSKTGEKVCYISQVP